MEDTTIRTKTHTLSLENEEYELTMNLSQTFIEFKLVPKRAPPNFYYKENFDLSTINKCLSSSFKELKKAFEIYDRQLERKEVKLIKLNEDSINLNLIKKNSFDEEEEINLELKKYAIKEEEAFPILLRQYNEMKQEMIEMQKNINEMKKEIISIKEKQRNENNKNIDILIEDYLKRKKEEEIKKQKEEEIKRQEEENKIRQEEEEKLKKNDNVNLINDFKCENIDNMQLVDHISNGKLSLYNNNVAVYSIIRDNERLYELACGKIGQYSTYYKYYNYDIVLYNIVKNKITNEICDAHQGGLNSIKHYWYYPEKKHFLLSSCNYSNTYSSYNSIKLWNISSIIITNELTIDSDNSLKSNNSTLLCYCSCLLFNDENYFILGGFNSNASKPMIFNKGGGFKETINKSNIETVNYIETTYIKNEPYVLLAGSYSTESYDFNNGTLKSYQPIYKEKPEYSSIINIFNKDNTAYLICGYNDGNVTIFNFESAAEICSINVSDSGIYGLCSLNEKYFLVSDNKGLKVIDFETKKSKQRIKNSEKFLGTIVGIKKIKIPQKGEFIISFTGNSISFWN